MRKIFKPDYYDRFCCIADRCRHCCCIGWEIDIDADKLELYKNTEGEFGERLANGIGEETEAHFVLSEGERCPFLNEENLCDIIVNMGEEALCSICRDHPRFRNFYSEGVEIGIGMCCEEAARIIVTNKDVVMISGEGVLDGEEEIFFRMREQVFAILQDGDWRIDERCDNLCELYDLRLPNKNWEKMYRGLERLDDAWGKKLDLLKNRDMEVSEDWDLPFEQIIVYFVYRHLQEGLYDGFIEERLLFAILSYKVIRKIFSYGPKTMEELIEICRMYSSEIEYSEKNMMMLFEELSA